MSAIPYQQPWLAVLDATFRPNGEDLTLVERAVLAVYVERWRAGERDLVVRDEYLVARTGIKGRTAWDARKRLLETGCLRELRKGGGKGRPSSYAVVERVVFARSYLANAAGINDPDTSQSARGNGAHSSQTPLGIEGGFSPHTSQQPRVNGVDTSQKTSSNLAKSADRSERDHARAHEGEPATSHLDAHGSERDQEETSQAVRGMRGTPREDAGTPPRSDQRPSKVVVIHIPSGHQGPIDVAAWAADQVLPREQQLYMKPVSR